LYNTAADFNERSAIYQGESEAQPFAVTLERIAKTVTSLAKAKQKEVDQDEEARLTIMKDAERIGYDHGRASGYEEGYQDGRAFGISEARSEFDQALADELARFVEELNKFSESLQVQVNHWFEASENRITDLAMAAVRKILVSELELSRDSALEIVKDALGEVTHSRHVRIRVNPFDSVILREHRQEIMSAAENLRDIEIVTDPAILGGCMIESDGGVVDATVETKLILLDESIRRAA
jgi:flagellar assembly protein FliH